jgi:replicative DNA helicase
MSNSKNKLANNFGSEFQIKSITCICTDAEFFGQIIDILDPTFFTGESKQWIVEKAIDFYRQYKDEPTLNYFHEETKNIGSDSLRASVENNLRKVWTKRSETDLDYVKEHFLEFCKQQKVKNTIEESVDLLQVGDYDTIKSKMDEALSAGLKKDVGHDYMEDAAERMETSARDTVETGWPVLDGEVLDGGLGPGEIGVFMGATGAGKSWMLSALGANAMKSGKRVVHYTLELSENQTGLRYDSVFTGHSPTDVQDHKEEVLSTLEHIPGNVSIQYWPTKGASTQTIQAHIDRMETVKWKPDLILIDYADLLKPLGAQRSDSNYEKMGNIYEDLRKLSGEVGVPIWTVSQTQRQAVREKVVKGDRIADSWKKAMTADFICSLSRTDTDKLADTARFHVIKSRFGPDGKTYPAIMSTATGNIRIFDPEKEEGKKLLAKMDENEDKRKKEEISKEWQRFKFRNKDRNGKIGAGEENNSTSIGV